MTAPVLASPAREVRRLRAEIEELQGILAAHVAADPGLTVSLSTARQWSAEAYSRGRADGIEAGRLAVIAELKTADRAVRAALELEIRRWGPGGRAQFGDPRPGDYVGTGRAGR